MWGIITYRFVNAEGSLSQVIFCVSGFQDSNVYLHLHDIPFCQTKDNAMVTYAADFGWQPNQTMHINTYMMYLFENARPRTMQWWPLHLIWVTSNQTKQYIFTPTWYTILKMPDQGQCKGDQCSWFGWKPKKNHTKPNNGYSHLHYIPNDTHSLSYSTSKDAIVYKIFLIIGSFLNIRFLDNVQ